VPSKPSGRQVAGCAGTGPTVEHPGFGIHAAGSLRNAQAIADHAHSLWPRFAPTFTKNPGGAPAPDPARQGSARWRQRVAVGEASGSREGLRAKEVIIATGFRPLCPTRITPTAAKPFSPAMTRSTWSVTRWIASSGPRLIGLEFAEFSHRPEACEVHDDRGPRSGDATFESRPSPRSRPAA